LTARTRPTAPTRPTVPTQLTARMQLTVPMTTSPVTASLLKYLPVMTSQVNRP
jgi:hypothetical protein